MTETNESFRPAAATSFPHEAAKKGFWGKLKTGLFMTHTEILERMDAAVQGRGVLDDKTLEFLEESLISSDLGVETSLKLVARLKERIRNNETRDLGRMRSILAEEVSTLLGEVERPRVRKPENGAIVTLVVGVNGVGKTTTIAKLAHYGKSQGEKVLLAAGDTFRAAAIDQLALWGERIGVDVIRQKPGGDPAAVVFDALQAGRARRIDRVIVDTAGRLHNKDHLMQELAKISRVIQREAAGWPVETLLVLDATTGNNAINQAREFARVVPVDGIVLTKLDGTAKGGMVVSVSRELRLPILFVGIGEKAEDLIEFRAAEFASALFE